MRVAVIADVHGNCGALDAVLADLEARPVDRIVCLGDMIQGGHNRRRPSRGCAISARRS